MILDKDIPVLIDGEKYSDNVFLTAEQMKNYRKNYATTDAIILLHLMDTDMINTNEILEWWSEYRQDFIDNIYPWSDGRSTFAAPELKKQKWAKDLVDSFIPINEKIVE